MRIFQHPFVFESNLYPAQTPKHAVLLPFVVYAN